MILQERRSHGLGKTYTLEINTACFYIQEISQNKKSAMHFDTILHSVDDGWRAHLQRVWTLPRFTPQWRPVQSQWRHSILLKKVIQAASLRWSASCQVKCQNKSLEQEFLISCVCEN